MTRVVGVPAFLSLAGILVSSVALAQVPSAALSSLGSGRLVVEGTTLSGGGAPDACGDGRCGALTITVNDDLGAPIPGSLVTVDFSGCPDINISCDQVPGTGQAYIGAHAVTGVTNGLGQFTFQVQGAGPTFTATCGAINCGGTNAGVACAAVSAGAVPAGVVVPLGNLRVAAFDIDRAGSPNGAVAVGSDAAKVKREQLNVALGAQSRARDDYDFNGVVTVADVARATQYALDQGLGTGSRDTMHVGWSAWPSAGTLPGFCP